MTYARIENGTVAEVVNVGGSYRLPDGRWVSSATAADLEAAGLLTVVETVAAPPEGQQTAGSSVDVVAGVPTVVYTYQPIPAEQVNEHTIRASFTQAMTRSAQIKTQMDTIEAATFANNTQRDTAIKTLAEAVEDLNTAVRKLIRLADNRLDAAD